MAESSMLSPNDSTIDRLTLNNILAGIMQRRQSREQQADYRRLEVLADPAWIARVKAQAKRRRMSLSAYVGQAVTRQLKRDESEDSSVQNKPEPE